MVITFADRYTPVDHSNRPEGAKIILARIINSLAGALPLCFGLASRRPRSRMLSALRKRVCRPDPSALDGSYKLLVAETVRDL
jgi:hypothetical protein